MWHSGWPRTELALDIADGEVLAHARAVNEQRLRAYVDIDARIARKFPLGDGSLAVFVEVSNALNRRNQCCTEFEIDDESDEPLLVRESIRSLPLLPSLGVVWRF